ncbi:MAG: osmotically inducible protein OsmC [Chlorobiaceae bacterium]|nr:osmotically inducible protein OsmC [Chlorobiaceae bacterium]MBA4309055.1 osmotically inducible protein OsmC [Chlorobiaceae bacterium]
MENVHFYNTTVTWKEGRVGEISEPTLPTISVATPPQFPKGVPNIWSPEHLFVAAANVCLMTTFLSISEFSKLNFISYEADAIGKLEKIENKFIISEIEITAKVKVTKEEDVEKADRLLHKSEANCLISNSMKTKVHLKTEITF